MKYYSAYAAAKSLGLTRQHGRISTYRLLSDVACIVCDLNFPLIGTGTAISGSFFGLRDKPVRRLFVHVADDQRVGCGDLGPQVLGHVEACRVDY